MSLAPSDSLFQLAENYHLWPTVFLLLFVGVVSVLALVAKACFRYLAEVVEAYYDFKTQYVESKNRYEQAIERTVHRPAS